MANIITGIRIVCALALLFCPTFSGRFYALYLLGGVSDVLDGFAARRLGKETKLGAQLDTVADIVFTGIVLLKVVRTVTVPAWLTVWTACIAAVKCVGIVSGFVLHKRFVSEHTILNKVCGVLLFAIPLGIGWLPWQPVEGWMILTCAVATVAAVQEGYYIRTGKEIGWE